jgi:uncharacterized membrane protein
MMRWVLSAMLLCVGLGHFIVPHDFEAIVPEWLPAPDVLVFVSGLAEIAGAIGLQIAALRRAAAWGLVLLFVAVFPANLNMAFNAERFAHLIPAWALWARLPLQGLLIWWAWRYTRPDTQPGPSAPV